VKTDESLITTANSSTSTVGHLVDSPVHEAHLLHQAQQAADKSDFDTTHKILSHLAEKTADPKKQNIYLQQAEFYKPVKFSRGTMKEVKFDNMPEHIQKHIVQHAQALKKQHDDLEKEHLDAAQQYNSLFEPSDNEKLPTEGQIQHMSHRFETTKDAYQKAKVKFEHFSSKIPHKTRQQHKI